MCTVVWQKFPWVKMLSALFSLLGTRLLRDAHWASHANAEGMTSGIIQFTPWSPVWLRSGSSIVISYSWKWHTQWRTPTPLLMSLFYRRHGKKNLFGTTLRVRLLSAASSASRAAGCCLFIRFFVFLTLIKMRRSRHKKEKQGTIV